MSVSVSELLRAFTRIGLMSFGGPAAQIAVMHKELVEDRPWLTETQFLNALSFCMLLPGPEAMQLATYCGWRLRGLSGGLIAGLLFVMPGALVMAALAAIYVVLGDVPWVEALFVGIKATVVVIVLQALLKVGQKALRSADRWVLAGLSFLAIFAFNLPFPLIIALAAVYGLLRGNGAGQGASSPPPAAPSPLAASSLGGLIRTILAWGALWWAPIAALWLAGQELLTQLGLFFSKLAIVTFGGAYAVLAYMTQEVVQSKQWISTEQMMDGLGLAETTPGPLILVTEFVGFLAGYGAGGWGMALSAAALTIWVTFVPCFLWIFAGAPFIDWISNQPRLARALQAITAAVVGVILNLSLWFALHVFFSSVALVELGPMRLSLPDIATLDLVAAGLAVCAAVFLLRLRLGMITTLGMVAGLGVVGAGLGI